MNRQDGRVGETPTETGDYVVIMTTVGSEDVARELSRALVEEGLAACAQRFAVDSIYRWKGEVADDREALILLKTRRDRIAEVREAVAARHPYEVPEILELPVTGGWPAYLAWVDEHTAPAG